MSNAPYNSMVKNATFCNFLAFSHALQCVEWVWVSGYWLLNVTINDISVIYVTAQMCKGTEEVRPTVGLPRHRHFVGFLNTPVWAPTWVQPFYVYSVNSPNFNQLLRRTWGYRGPIVFQKKGLQPWCTSNSKLVFGVSLCFFSIAGRDTYVDVFAILLRRFSFLFLGLHR